MKSPQEALFDAAAKIADGYWSDDGHEDFHWYCVDSDLVDALTSAVQRVRKEGA